MTTLVCQERIQRQFTKYLILKNVSLESRNKIINERGSCFGFSLCHAAMAIIGKLLWWQAVLRKISKWDGTKSSLSRLITPPLPQQNNPNKPETLDNLFKRAINYVAFQQANIELPVIKNISINQEMLLKENGFFEIQVGQVIKKIKNRKVISGYFTANSLKKLILPKLISGNICLISCHFPKGAHCCSVRYDEKGYFYDPEYDYGEKKCENIQELVKEIFTRLSHALAITFLALEHFNFQLDHYSKMLQSQKNILIKKSSLSIMARHAPEVLTRRLQMFPDPVLQNIAKGFRKVSCKKTGLQHIVMYAPRAFYVLVEKVKASKSNSKLRKCFAKALVKKCNNEQLDLQYTEHQAHETLETIFLNLKNNNDLNFLIENAGVLTIRNKPGEPFLHYFVRQHRQNSMQLVKMVKWVKPGSRLRKYFAKALTMQDKKFKWSGLHSIAFLIPDALTILFSITDDPGFFNDFAKALILKNSDQKSGFSFVKRSALKSFPELVKKVNASKSDSALRKYFAQASVMRDTIKQSNF